MQNYFKKIYWNYKNWRLKKHVEKFGSKNIGYFLTFDKMFFEKWQRVILFALNMSVINIYFRWIFRIHKLISFKEKIYKISFNFFEVQTGDNTFKRITFTHNKFSKRIYYGFFPVWWALHFIDWLLLERFELLPNFGFATLTAYPDPLSGSTTVDGYAGVAGTSVDWSTIRGLSSAVNNNGSMYYSAWDCLCDSVNNKYYSLYRAFFTFDTSSIPVTATISDALFSIHTKTLYRDGASNHDLHVVQSSQNSANNIIGADFAAVGNTSFGSLLESSVSADTRYVISLNVDGINNINKGGISQFATKIGADFSNSTPPTWGAWKGVQHQIYFADNTGTTYDPYLEVDYTSTIVRPVTATTTASANISATIKRILNGINNITASLTGTAKINKVVSEAASSSASLNASNKLNLYSGSQINISAVSDIVASLTRQVSGSSNFTASFNVVNKLNIVRTITADINASLNVTNKINLVKNISAAIEEALNAEAGIKNVKGSTANITASLEVINRLMNIKSSTANIIGTIDFTNKLTVTRIVNAYLTASLTALNKLIMHTGSTTDISASLDADAKLNVIKSMAADIISDLDVLNKLTVTRPATAELTAEFLADCTISISLINALIFNCSLDVQTKLTKLTPATAEINSALHASVKINRVMPTVSNITAVSDFILSAKLVKNTFANLSVQLVIDAAIDLYKSGSLNFEAVSDIAAKLTNTKSSSLNINTDSDIIAKLTAIKTAYTEIEANTDFIVDAIVSGKLYQVSASLIAAMDASAKVTLSKSAASNIQSSLDVAVRTLNYHSASAQITANMIADLSAKYYMNGTVNIEAVSDIVARLINIKPAAANIESVLEVLTKANLYKSASADISTSLDAIVKLLNVQSKTLQFTASTSIELSRLIRIVSESVSIETSLDVDLMLKVFTIYNEILELVSRIERELNLESGITLSEELSSAVTRELILDSFIHGV